MRWLVLLVAACSSAPPAERPRPAPPAPPAPLAQPAPSERECDDLITHAVKLGIDEQAARPTPHASAADHEAIRRKLHEDYMSGCQTLPREAYRCALAATTLADFAACQPTRSSSTSNSSVAPGGMTPPAPRSP